ncbi:ATP/GTP-binding protein [Planktothrix serta PCC 8927]|uniref:ATP/GTP-binding protein n=1 Tax=Planktothrix serta PCC 8927 TaxID=671068 RepID=A0A7Z9BNY0_9CYAN|nr:AAA family ATPase [Planktothrix serta]VXD13739.1 ATP/GTP-binding protein [Planktothrix serta PCC 8927]
MNMISSNLKSFSVYGLFGTNDVHIPFDKNIKILIGENGLGKTQVLNMFYYTLCKKFEKLIDYCFDKLELEFIDGKTISISKREIEQTFFKHPVAVDLINKIGIHKFIDLKQEFANKSISSYQFRNNPMVRQIVEDLPFSTGMILDILRRLSDETEDNFSANLQECKKTITESLNQSEIMYFPTYRRVEEDLKNLGYDEEQFHKEDNRLIHFGMTDVRKRFDEIENTIDKLLKEGFSKISGEILSQLVKGFTDTDTSILSRIDQKDIEIILARVGEQLSEADKNEIRNIVVNQEIKNDSLLYFLQKLIEIYEKQKPLDNFIKVYRDICNKYLIDKKIFYDESAIRIFVKSDLSGEEIQLSKLSSGEKQIISILSKIYLAEDKQRFIVLFDEPELSLSIIWQRQLLPDILNSNKCDFLLAVTHSPFIFDNELDRYAVGLNEYVKPAKTITTECHT